MHMTEEIHTVIRARRQSRARDSDGGPAGLADGGEPSRQSGLEFTCRGTSDAQCSSFPAPASPPTTPLLLPDKLRSASLRALRKANRIVQSEEQNVSPLNGNQSHEACTPCSEFAHTYSPTTTHSTRMHSQGTVATQSPPGNETISTVKAIKFQ